jgi:uncharacterized tellurite resistance protein B-like protein
MIKRLGTFFRRLEADPKSQPDSADEMALAATALLVETAVMDGGFDDDERATITRLIGGRFELEPDEARALVDEAEQAIDASHQLFRYTKAINDHFSLEQRVELMEMLWEVAYADGIVHHFEENLLRRIAGLIYVSDQDRGLTRNAVRDRLGLD